MGRIEQLEEENRYLKCLLDFVVEDVSPENIERVRSGIEPDYTYAYVIGNVRGSLSAYVDCRKKGGIYGKPEKRK